MERENFKFIRKNIADRAFVLNCLGRKHRYILQSILGIEGIGWLAFDCPLQRSRESLTGSPITTFDEGIKKTIQWYLDNKSWWENIISGEYQNYYERMYEGI